jgi:cobalt ECF transporter T component CbiQ
VGITAQGLTSAGLIVSRVATSISLVVLLTLTTPWVRLLGALRSLGVPRIFILIIGMAYRYLFLLLASVTDMYEARKARTVGATPHDKEARSFVAASAGALFGKANILSEEVYQAMTARGYRGTPRTLQRAHLYRLDVVFAVAAVAVGAVLLWGDGHFAY